MKYLTEQTLEVKISYINAISFFLAKNPNKVKEKKLIELIHLLKLEAIQEDLLEFFQEPDREELDETFETIREYGVTYIAHLFYLVNKNSFSKSEKQFLEFAINKFGLSNNIMGDIHTFINLITTEDKFSLRELSVKMLKDKKLINGLESFTTIYGFSNPRAEALKQEIVRKFECYDFNTFSDNDFFKKNFTDIDDIIKDDINFIIELFQFKTEYNINKGDYVFYIAEHFTTEKTISNKDLMIKLVNFNGKLLNLATEELKDDKEVILEAVKQNGKALNYASDNLKSDKEVVLEAINQDGEALFYANRSFRDKRDIVLEAVKQDGYTLSDASDRLKNDKEVVLEAVKQKGKALEYASDNLKNDKEVVLEAVKQSGRALEYASYNLKRDKEVVLEAVKQDGDIFYYTCENSPCSVKFYPSWENAIIKFRNDRDIALEAVKQNGRTLECASSFKNDREVVLEAIKQDGWALNYASDNLKNDKEIVLKAVKQDGWALNYASDNLKNDKEIVLEAVKQKGDALSCANKIFRKDKEVVLEAVKQDGEALYYARDNLKNDKEIVLAAIKQNPKVIDDASDTLKHDKDCLDVLNSLHPLRAESDKIKNLYFGIVSYFVQDKANKSTKKRVRLLKKSLSIQTYTHPNIDVKFQYKNFKELFRHKAHLDALCLMDILYILDLNHTKDALLEKIRKFFEISKDDFKVVYNFAIAIRHDSPEQISDTIEKIITKTDLALKAKYIVGFYKIDFYQRKNLNEKYSALEKKVCDKKDGLRKVGDIFSGIFNWNNPERSEELEEEEYNKRKKELESQEKYYVSLIECFNNELKLIK